jgi:hypothetical protein
MQSHIQENVNSSLFTATTALTRDLVNTRAVASQRPGAVPINSTVRSTTPASTVRMSAAQDNQGSNMLQNIASNFNQSFGKMMKDIAQP